MEVNNVVPNQHYTCQQCDKQFRILTEQPIEPNIWPVCCKKCGNIIVEKLVRKLVVTLENISFMARICGYKPSSTHFNKERALKLIIKHYQRIGLPRIKVWLMGSNGNEPAQSHFSKLAQNTGSLVLIGYYEPLSRLSCPKFGVGPTLSHEPITKRGLGEWEI